MSYDKLYKVTTLGQEKNNVHLGEMLTSCLCVTWDHDLVSDNGRLVLHIKSKLI